MIMGIPASRVTALCALFVFATRAVEARGVEDLYRPGEVRTWVFEQDGKRIGWHDMRYEGTAGLLGAQLHRFSGRVEIDAMPQVGLPRQRYLGELFVDSSGRPSRSILEAELGESYSRVEISIAEGKAAVAVEQGPARRDLTIDVPEGAFIQANNFIGWFELMLAAGPMENDAFEAKLLLSNAVRVLPYRAARSTGPAAEAEEERGGRRLEDSLGQVIVLSEDSRVLLLAVPAQKLRIVPGDEPFEAFVIRRPQPEEPARDFEVEPVEIRHGEVVLAGEITRPSGASGRLPAVFFISGSGLQDRDGYTSGIDLGTHEILDRLTERGFLVLRVDDRGAGESTGPLDNLSFDDLVADARACVEHLFSREDVDARRVALIGHSEGGATVPILAAEDPRIAAIVLMAAAGRPIGEVILEQNAQALDLAGIEGEERQRILAEVRRWIERVSSDEAIEAEAVLADYRGLLQARAWLRSHARKDPLATLRRVQCPVLILQGAKDFQISLERDARVLARTLDEAGHPDHEIVVFDDLDHLFKRVKGEQSQLSDYFATRPVDEGFLDTLSAWLAARLQAEPGP